MSRDNTGPPFMPYGPCTGREMVAIIHPRSDKNRRFAERENSRSSGVERRVDTHAGIVNRRPFVRPAIYRHGTRAEQSQPILQRTWRGIARKMTKLEIGIRQRERESSEIRGRVRSNPLLSSSSWERHRRHKRLKIALIVNYAEP